MPNKVVWTFLANDRFSRIAQRIKTKTAAMKNQFRSLNTTMKKTSAKMKAIGQSMKYMSIIATGAVIGSLKAFGDMEKGITNVLTLMDDDQMDKFGGKIQELATTSLTQFGFSTEETTKALFDNVSALGTSKKSLEAFSAAQRLAIGGVAGLDVAVDGITSIMNAYSDGSQTSEEVANSFFAAQKAGKTTVTDLANNIGKVAPSAKAAGIGFEELLATMAQLTLGGLSTEEAATSLKGAITSLLKPSKEAEKILKAEGIAFGATALGAQPLVKTLEQIAKLREKNEDLLIQAIPNIRGFTAVASLEADSLKQIIETRKSMSTDLLSPAFEKQMKTLNVATSILKQNFVAMGITIGAALAPGFLWIAGVLRGMIDWFQGLSDTSKKWFSYLLVAVAVSAALFIAAAAAIAVFGAAFGVVATAIGAIMGFIISWPFAIAAAIMAAGAAIWAYWDEIKGVAGTVMDWVGLGGDEIKGSAELNSNSRIDGELKIKTEKGTTAELKSKTTGVPTGFKFGMAMETAS
jgi:TP901 family phage tail tape measure protein